MSGATAAAGAAQIVGGIALAPLLPGLVQHWKARLQGRRGPSPLQPYRELRRLWGKSTVTPEGASVVYRLAPVDGRGESRRCCSDRPGRGVAPSWGIGHDVLALLGLLALARFALAAASWDVAQRLLADGCEPRPHALGLRRGDPCALARGRRADRGHDRPASASSRRPPAPGLVEPGARARRARVRRSSSSPRPAASRSTTRTRISS